MKKKESYYRIILIVLVLISILSILLAVGFGPVHLSFQTVYEVILDHLHIFPHDLNSTNDQVVWNLRLPRVLLGFIVGAALSISGVVMQVLVRNEMADPFVLGISSGASVTATLGMIFGLFSIFGPFSTAISAFIGAIITTILVYTLSCYHHKIVVTQLLLSGLVISMMLDGVTKIITLSAPNALGLHNAEFWMSGSLAGAKWEYLTVPLVIMLLTMIYLLLHYRILNVMLLGEDSAMTTGVNIKYFQKILMVVSSLLIATTISVSGVVGFVGLICPHLSRLIVGSDHKKVLPVSALLGGILVVWTDVLARTLIAPQELPLGTLTAIIGGPLFIILLKRKRTH